MKKRKPKRKTVARNISPTLGKVPVTARSLVSIGGERASCQWIKKRNSKARRAGFPDAASMEAAMAKFLMQQQAARVVPT